MAAERKKNKTFPLTGSRAVVAAGPGRSARGGAAAARGRRARREPAGRGARRAPGVGALRRRHGAARPERWRRARHPPVFPAGARRPRALDRPAHLGLRVREGRARRHALQRRLQAGPQDIGGRGGDRAPTASFVAGPYGFFASYPMEGAEVAPDQVFSWATTIPSRPTIPRRWPRASPANSATATRCCASPQWPSPAPRWRPPCAPRHRACLRLHCAARSRCPKARSFA